MQSISHCIPQLRYQAESQTPDSLMEMAKKWDTHQWQHKELKTFRSKPPLGAIRKSCFLADTVSTR